MTRPSFDPSRSGKPTPPLDWAVDHGFGEEIAQAARQRARARRRKRHTVAATLAATFAVGLWWTLPVAPPPTPELAAESTRVLGPQRTTLPDGSVVHTRSESVLSTDFLPSQRQVKLSAGEAYFAVARDPARPFVVRAGFVSVRALGTEFTVNHTPEAVTVLVTEGTVAVELDRLHDAEGASPASPPSPPSILSAGQRLTVPRAKSVPVLDQPAPAEIAQTLAWRVPRLSFSGASLAEVAAQFARHGGVQIELADPALEKVQISGVLRAGNSDALFRLLANDHGIRAERRGDGFVLHRGP